MKSPWRVKYNCGGGYVPRNCANPKTLFSLSLTRVSFTFYAATTKFIISLKLCVYTLSHFFAASQN